MIPAFIVTIILLAALLGYALRREGQRLDYILGAHRDEVRHLVDQITLIKVEPKMAAIQAVPEAVTNVTPLALADDGAVAEYEVERASLEKSTREFIEQHASEADVA